MTVGSQVKSCYASLKSAEATIEGLSNKIQDQQTKKDFENVLQIVSQVKDDMKKQVIFLSLEEPQYK